MVSLPVCVLSWIKRNKAFRGRVESFICLSHENRIWGENKGGESAALTLSGNEGSWLKHGSGSHSNIVIVTGLEAGY